MSAMLGLKKAKLLLTLLFSNKQTDSHKQPTAPIQTEDNNTTANS